MLEVRAPVGRDLEAKLSAVDQSRATEAARLDCIAFPRGSHCRAPALADLGTRPVAPARASARMGQDWFTKHTLAEALHVRAEEVQKWIDRGLLHSRTVETSGLQRQIIGAEDLCDFCKRHLENRGPQVECGPAEFCADICFSTEPHPTVARPGSEERIGGVRRAHEETDRLGRGSRSGWRALV